MKATFEHSVDVLVKAYMNDTLVHGVCTACAVGNLIADSMNTRPAVCYGGAAGFAFRTMENGTVIHWNALFMTNAYHEQNLDFLSDRETGIKQIEATGYSVEQMARIEFAFETVRPMGHTDYTPNDTYIFNGLIAVVEVLADIHGVDLSVKQSAVDQFQAIHSLK